MKFSELTVGRIQHWLDTPIGAIYGYPDYGNNIEQLLFINRQKAPATLSMILHKLGKDLGEAVTSEIREATILRDKDRNDTFYVMILLSNNMAIGEYNV